MFAPERFALWLNQHRHYDSELGLSYHYHPRSDAHSKILAEYIWEDLLQICPAMRKDHTNGYINAGINYKYTWPGTRKAKTIDLAVGQVKSGKLVEVYVSCELKACMTEHKKSEPRIFDELSSSHEIVHRADNQVIAAGLTVVNISDQFISPLRQRKGEPLDVTIHHQPHAAASMIQHLHGLALRNTTDQVGFDAYSTFVVDCDNDPSHGVRLWTAAPAPQEGDPHHYLEFLSRIASAYTDRFAR